MLHQATKEFVQSQKLLGKLLQIKKIVFFEFKKQNAELKKFIKAKYTHSKQNTKSKIITNNFIGIYKKMVAVMPSITLDWGVLKSTTYKVLIKLTKIKNSKIFAQFKNLHYNDTKNLRAGVVEKIIKERLDSIEQRYGVRILYACESGSRAWNFASKDSDYDVRFVYVRPLSWYLGISDKRDVIEEPILDEFDINGWDLQKFLKLAFKSNVVVFEWLKSPIIYRKSELWDEINTLCFEYFSVKASLYHYLNMAERNYRLYLAPPHIKLKKIFLCFAPAAFFLLHTNSSKALTYGLFGVA